MALRNASTRIGLAGGLAAAIAITSLSGLTGPAASAGPVATTTVERAAAPALETDATVPVTAPPAPTTVAPTTTTTPPPATTAAPTTAPPTTAAPTTTAAPATTAPPTTAAPQEPAPVAAPAPQSAQAEHEEPEDRVLRVFASAVPQMWRDDIAVRFEIIDGSTSWAYGDGRILVARSHVDAREEHLADVLAHEFGHLIAFTYGTKAYPGAAPEGWPEPADSPEEAWADCVQTVFTGRTNPSHGLHACEGEQLDWAAAWLPQGPPAS